MPNIKPLKQYLILLLATIALLSQLALSQSVSLESRVAELEGREQIKRVMKQYGRFLDIRDFTAFGELFAETESTYVSGGETARGSAAIGKMLDDIITANPSKLRTPNFHVFFNETIEFTNPSEATAFSQSAYIVPSAANAPEMVFFASYEDVFIIEGGQWKFKQRIVLGEIPSRASQ